MLGIIHAVIKPFKLEDVKVALRRAGVTGLTVTEAQGYGRQGGHTETFRGSEYQLDFVPKLHLEVVVPLEDAEHIARCIADAARTGKVGDGKIWITSVERLMRIRTNEMGSDAL